MCLVTGELNNDLNCWDVCKDIHGHMLYFHHRAPFLSHLVFRLEQAMECRSRPEQTLQGQDRLGPTLSEVMRKTDF